jgi:hypothetical protein
MRSYTINGVTVSGDVIAAGAFAFECESPSLFEFSDPPGFGEALAAAYVAMAAVDVARHPAVTAKPQSRSRRASAGRHAA